MRWAPGLTSPIERTTGTVLFFGAARAQGSIQEIGRRAKTSRPPKYAKASFTFETNLLQGCMVESVTNSMVMTTLSWSASAIFVTRCQSPSPLKKAREPGFMRYARDSVGLESSRVLISHSSRLLSFSIRPNSNVTRSPR